MEVDPVHVLVGVGAQDYVAYVVLSGVIFKDKTGHVHVSDHIRFLDPHVIGVDLSGYPGDVPPLVEVEGLEVGVADVRVEFVKGV